MVLQCKSEDRPHIIINDQPTIELDYKANHLYFIYALENKEVPRFTNNDPYCISNNIPRKIIKSIFTTSINTSSSLQAYMAIRKEIRIVEDREKALWRQHMSSYRSFNKIVTLLIEKHPVLKSYLFKKKGIRLQFIDSKVAEFVLDRMTTADVATLCVHDSFIVQRSKEAELRKCMKEAYKFIGYPKRGV